MEPTTNTSLKKSLQCEKIRKNTSINEWKLSWRKIVSFFSWNSLIGPQKEQEIYSNPVFLAHKHTKKYNYTHCTSHYHSNVKYDTFVQRVQKKQPARRKMNTHAALSSDTSDVSPSAFITPCDMISHCETVLRRPDCNSLSWTISFPPALLSLERQVAFRVK